MKTKQLSRRRARIEISLLEELGMVGVELIQQQGGDEAADAAAVTGDNQVFCVGRCLCRGRIGLLSRR
jgi:hypothetical protein